MEIDTCGQSLIKKSYSIKQSVANYCCYSALVLLYKIDKNVDNSFYVRARAHDSEMFIYNSLTALLKILSIYF